MTPDVVRPVTVADDPVLSRRSVRAYSDEPVSEGEVERLLRAAMAAPSAGNQQPWQFVVVRESRDSGRGDRVPSLRRDAQEGAAGGGRLRRHASREVASVLGTGLFGRHPEPAGRGRDPRPRRRLAGRPSASGARRGHAARCSGCRPRWSRSRSSPSATPCAARNRPTGSTRRVSTGSAGRATADGRRPTVAWPTSNGRASTGNGRRRLRPGRRSGGAACAAHTHPETPLRGIVSLRRSRS